MSRGRPSVTDKADRNLHIRCLSGDLKKIQSLIRRVKELLVLLRKQNSGLELPARTSASILCYALASYCKFMELQLSDELKVKAQEKEVFSLLGEDPDIDVNELEDRTGFDRSFILRCIRSYRRRF